MQRIIVSIVLRAVLNDDISEALFAYLESFDISSLSCFKVPVICPLRGVSPSLLVPDRNEINSCLLQSGRSAFSAS